MRRIALTLSMGLVATALVAQPAAADSTTPTAAGSFQSEIGCPLDWMPDCSLSDLHDPDGDGIYHFTTTAIPAGLYETKVTIGGSWNENYGAGGVPFGPNIPFAVTASGNRVIFEYDSSTHILTIREELVLPTSKKECKGGFGTMSKKECKDIVKGGTGG